MADAESVLGTSGKEALPYEYQIQEQQIARRRALAEAMLQQGMRQPPVNQMAGNVVIRNSPLGGIAGALNNYLGMKGLGEADAQSQGLAQSVAQGQTQDFNPMAAAKTPGEMQAALATALTSRFPQVRLAAQNQQKQMADQFNNYAKLAAEQGADPTSLGVGFQTNNPADVKIPAPKPPTIVPGVMGTNGQPSQPAYAVTSEPKTGKQDVKWAQPGSNVSVNTGMKFDESTAEAARKAVSDNYKDASDAAGQLQRTTAVAELLRQNPNLVGGGQDYEQVLRKAAQAFGIDVTGVSGTETIARMLGVNMLAHARALAPVTQTDVSQLERILGGIGSDPKALQEGLAWMAADAHQAMDRHGRMIDAANQAGLKVSKNSPELEKLYGIQKPKVKGNDAVTLRTLKLLKDRGVDLSNYMVSDESGLPDSPASEMKFTIQSLAAPNLNPPALPVSPAGLSLGRGRPIKGP